MGGQSVIGSRCIVCDGTGNQTDMGLIITCSRCDGTGVDPGPGADVTRMRCVRQEGSR